MYAVCVCVCAPILFTVVNVPLPSPPLPPPQVRIDHLGQSLHFGTDLSLNLKEEVPEGPHVQSMPAETLRVQLSLLSQALQQAAHLISAEETSVRLHLSYSRSIHTPQEGEGGGGFGGERHWTAVIRALAQTVESIREPWTNVICIECVPLECILFKCSNE